MLRPFHHATNHLYPFSSAAKHPMSDKSFICIISDHCAPPQSRKCCAVSPRHRIVLWAPRTRRITSRSVAARYCKKGTYGEQAVRKRQLNDGGWQNPRLKQASRVCKTSFKGSRAATVGPSLVQGSPTHHRPVSRRRDSREALLEPLTAPIEGLTGTWNLDDRP